MLSLKSRSAPLLERTTLCLAICLAACHRGTPAVPAPGVQAAEGGEVVRYEGQAMGTSVVFTALLGDGADGEAAEEKVQDAFAAAFTELNRLEVLMTTWEHPGWPQSDLMAVNAAAGQHPVQVSPETFEVLQASQLMAERSNGAFDITFAALHGLWKFDEDLTPIVPDPAAIAERLARVDYRALQLDPAARTAYLARPGMVLSLGGIAKGYAVDACVRILRQAGLQDFLVQAGGDLYIAGSRGPRPWRVGIRDPRDPNPDAFFATTTVRDHAFSTAGDYERAFILNGQRYHHILDPHTGRPATASRSVTILAPSALLADSLDDAVFILGPEKGMELVRQYPGVEAVIVGADNHVHVSPGLQQTVNIVHAPTF